MIAYALQSGKWENILGQKLKNINQVSRWKSSNPGSNLQRSTVRTRENEKRFGKSLLRKIWGKKFGKVIKEKITNMTPR